MKRIHKLLALVAAAVLLLGIFPAMALAAAQARATLRPIIFVHGGSGSGSQFQTQAKRFASNGYPATHVEAHDYDSLFVNNTMEQVHAGLDQRIARLKAATGADKVELLGHSLGTLVSQQYLKSSAERAANVAHYVNIDGGSTAGAESPPVPTLAIWGEGSTDRKIEGATNLYHSGESHVQTTSSVATFKAAYEFFTGEEPATTGVTPESGEIQIAGRAVYFPFNTGLRDARLDIYPFDPATGRRTSAQPVATYQFGGSGDGSFGPFKGRGDVHYEFAMSKNGTNQVHHHYYQPFRRTDLGVRVLSGDPGGPLDWLIERNRNHVAMLVYRNKEWWGDQAANSDTLTLNRTNVLNASIAPRSKRACGVFLYDWRSDRRTNLDTTVGIFPVLPFISGADHYMPASATGTVTLETRQRAADGQTDRLTIPSWPSDTHMNSIYIDDYA